MRRAIDRPSGTVTLVTPDRSLARRVKAELARWNLAVTDSAGEPLSHTSEGTLAALLLAAVAPAAEPEHLVALLAHPAATFGLDRRDTAWAASLLEIGLLRGSRVSDGIAGLPAALQQRVAVIEAGQERVHRLVALMKPEDWQAIGDLVARLVVALADLEQMMARREPRSLSDFMAAHRAAIDATLAAPAIGQSQPFWSTPGGLGLARLFVEIETAAGEAPLMRGEDYRAFFDRAMAEAAIRPPAARLMTGCAFSA